MMMRKMLYLASAALAITGSVGVTTPATQAHCTVNVGWCTGHCTVNLGTCGPSGSCLVTVGYCNNSALIGV